MLSLSRGLASHRTSATANFILWLICKPTSTRPLSTSFASSSSSALSLPCTWCWKLWWSSDYWLWCWSGEFASYWTGTTTDLVLRFVGKPTLTHPHSSSWLRHDWLCRVWHRPHRPLLPISFASLHCAIASCQPFIVSLCCRSGLFATHGAFTTTYVIQRLIVEATRALP